MKYNVRYVVYRYGHHSPHSGYSRTAEFGAQKFGADIIRVDKPVSRHIVRQRMLWRLAKGTPGYDRSSLAAELQVAKRILRERNAIYHFLYGETTYHYAGKLNHHNDNKIVATYHLAPTSLENIVQIKWHLPQLSALICVGRNQCGFFSQHMDPKKVFFVPLGIDTEYFVPPDSFEDRDPDLCLMVGSNYRDYPTFRGVLELVSYLRPSTKFLVVTSQKNWPELGQHPNMILRSNIPEEEFRELYQKASLMVTPLTDATANNAVLESMACGLPVVTNDVGAIRDYTDSSAAAVLPAHDTRAMTDKILELLGDPVQRKEMSIGAREKSLQYAWPKTMEMLREVYETIE